MPDNQTNPADDAFALPGMQVVSLRGPDAQEFAHAQFASDAKALPVGHWQWSCWLTAKGRVIAVFALARPEAGRLLMLLPDGRAEAIATQLRRYVFRRKVAIDADGALHPAAACHAPAQARGAVLAAAGGALELDMGGPGLPRTLYLSADAAPEDPVRALAWDEADLRLGLPRLADSQVEQWTPQQLGLDRIAAYSVHKGCYPGQEIVARTHFLGRAKRATKLLQAEGGHPQPGDEVRPGGTVVAASGALALAVVPLDEDAARDWGVGGVAAHELPFADGLAR